MAASREEAVFGAAARAFHIAVETSKRSRAWTGSLAAPARSAPTAVSFQTVAIERPPVFAALQSGRRYDNCAAGPAVRFGGTRTSTIRSARTSCRTLSLPHG